MSETRVRLGSAGRIVIPAEYREALGLEPGAELVLVLEKDELRITTTRQAVKRAQALVRSAISPDARLADALIAERRDEA